MSIIRSFVKSEERLEKGQAVIQAVEKTSTENNEQELFSSSFLVPQEQFSGLGTLDCEAVVESMTNVKNTRRRGKLYQIHWCWSFPNWPICWWKWKQVRTFNNVETFHIPSSLVLNLDQTNRKYISVGKRAMAKKGSNSVSISGLSGKRSMTTTFTITLNGNFSRCN